MLVETTLRLIAFLNYDLIILDEASMIDTNLFKELISRIDFAKTSLIIVGDDAQLPPIGKGSPFADIYLSYQ